MALAKRHGLRPLLINRLRQLDPAANDLREETIGITAHNLRATAALIEIAAGFANANIRVMGYKGPALAALLHRNVALREFLDLDLLVSRTDVPAAVTILEGLGYARDLRLTEAQQRDYLSNASTFTFEHRSTRLPIELHWQLSNRYTGVRFHFDDLWARKVQVDLGSGNTIPTFSPMDQLLVLALHGTRHFWESLCWLVDIAYLLDRHPLDFDRVFRESARLHLTGMVILALQLAHSCLGLNVPAYPAFDPEVIRQSLALCFRRINTASSPTALSLAEHRAFAKLLGDRRAMLRYFVLLMSTPGPAEWAEFPLPDRLHFAYPLVRLVRMMRRARPMASR